MVGGQLGPSPRLEARFFLISISSSRIFITVSPGSPNPTFPTETFYGKPLENCSFLVDVVLEGKMGNGAITNDQVGQLFRYLSALSETGVQHPRGIIYNSSEFIFAEYRTNQLTDILKCHWDMSSAWEVLGSKIRPGDWNVKINVLLALKSQDWIFERVLGRGRFGLVCEAFYNGNRYALKIDGSDPADVTAEFARLVQCHSQHPDLVVAPTPNSLAIIGEGSYYTMDEIGTVSASCSWNHSW
jgi:hypothetical protein